MSKYLGSIDYGDVNALEEIVRQFGYSTDIASDLPYFDAEGVWAEADEYYEAKATNEAEVRISGLNYIEVYKGDE